MKNENSPKQSPQLIRVRERNTAADADILRSVLLEQISEHPDEATEHEPKENGTGTHKFSIHSTTTMKADGKYCHGHEFADREERNERQRIHPREIRFAVGNIHRSPERAGAEGGKNSCKSLMRSGLVRGRNRQQGGSAKHRNCASNHAKPALPSGVVQFVEEHESPEDPQQAVGIPQRKGNAESDVADGINRQGIGHRPHASGEHSPDDEVRSLANISPQVPCPANEGGNTPAGEENAKHHHE